jgi:hypothetical protein
MRGVVPKGATLESVRVIAGRGTSSVLRDAYRLSDMYGGQLLLWEKKCGKVNTDNFIYDVHWYEYNEKQYDQKVKPPKKRSRGT